MCNYEEKRYLKLIKRKGFLARFLRLVNHTTISLVYSLIAGESQFKLSESTKSQIYWHGYDYEVSNGKA